ncbi:MAG TPA: leucyl/phenylalanyl-tRNA--protein transferase [Steroidobacteraceae bacterium]|nr:leucyl/phenylalanyl-tRNA--protein transferase [Steroidobacteraceae bacterium]
MTRSIVWISENDAAETFPPVERALKEPSGLLAAGGDLSPTRLLAAYRRGIFPWYSAGQPILWWSPDPRAVLYPQALKISRSFAKTLRNRGYETRIDTAFDTVIRACGSTRLRPGGTWLSPEMTAAYQRLHELGYAHSIETWLDGRLAGGLYGVSLGRVFFGESMFSTERDASKVALKRLCDECMHREVAVIDCQMETPHLMSLGASLMTRAEFSRQVAVLTGTASTPRPWS